jgi:hypothetical protein
MARREFDRRTPVEALGESAWIYLARGTLTWLAIASGIQLKPTTTRAVFRRGHVSLGLAAVEAEDGKRKLALTMASAADVLAENEGIVNVYSVDSLSQRPRSRTSR